MTVYPSNEIKMDRTTTPALAKVAVVGCGNWGKNLARNFHVLESLQAICDLDPARLELMK